MTQNELESIFVNIATGKVMSWMKFVVALPERGLIVISTHDLPNSSIPKDKWMNYACMSYAYGGLDNELCIPITNEIREKVSKKLDFGSTVTVYSLFEDDWYDSDSSIEEIYGQALEEEIIEEGEGLILYKGEVIDIKWEALISSDRLYDMMDNEVYDLTHEMDVCPALESLNFDLIKKAIVSEVKNQVGDRTGLSKVVNIEEIKYKPEADQEDQMKVAL